MYSSQPTLSGTLLQLFTLRRICTETVRLGASVVCGSKPSCCIMEQICIPGVRRDVHKRTETCDVPQRLKTFPSRHTGRAFDRWTPCRRDASLKPHPCGLRQDASSERLGSALREEVFVFVTVTVSTLRPYVSPILSISPNAGHWFVTVG